MEQLAASCASETVDVPLLIERDEGLTVDEGLPATRAIAFRFVVSPRHHRDLDAPHAKALLSGVGHLLSRRKRLLASCANEASLVVRVT